MTKRTFLTFQALILAVLGLFLLSRVWNGSILFYINRRFVILVFLAGLGLMALSQVLLRIKTEETEAPEGCDTDCSHGREQNPLEQAGYSGWNLAWMVVPLILGLALQARPLGSAAAANRGMTFSAPLSVQNEDTELLVKLPPGQRNILEWIVLFEGAQDQRIYQDEPVDVSGFVYKDARLNPGEFMVGRFMLTCCAADAMAIGMVVIPPDSGEVPENSWVRVQGKLTAYPLGGQKIPAINALRIDPVPEPDQPYLIP